MSANTLTGLINNVYLALDVVSRELTGFIPSVMLDTGAEQAAKDQNIKIHVAPASSAGDISPANVPPDPGGQTFSTVTLTLDKMRRVLFPWQGEEQRSVSVASGPGALSLQQDQIAQAIRTLVNEIEVDIAAEYVAASRAFGTAGTSPFASNLNGIPEVRKILADNGAPMGDLQLVIDTVAGTDLRQLTQLTNVDQAGESSLLRQGVLSNLFGFSVRESAQVASHTKGTGASYLINDASPALGDTSLTVDTGTGTIVAGDVITLGGGADKYVVKTALSGSTVVIANPGTVSSYADNDAVALSANYTANMAFSRSAMLAAIRAPEVPSGGDMRRDSEVITDPRTGISLLLSWFPGYYQNAYELAAVWGTKCIKPEHTALLLG